MKIFQNYEEYLEHALSRLEVVSNGSKVFIRASSLAPVFFPKIHGMAEQKEAFMRLLQEKILVELPLCTVEEMFCYTSFVFNDIIIDDYEISEKGFITIFTWFIENTVYDHGYLFSIELVCLKLFQNETIKFICSQKNYLEKKLQEMFIKYTKQLEKNLQIEKAYAQLLQNMLDLKEKSKQNAEVDVLEEFKNIIRQFLPAYEQLTA